jgi:cupin fold WbuC family metalloprotein
MNESVQYLNAIAIDARLVAALTELTFSNSGTRRLCLHKTESAPLHVMLVESLSGTPFPAHCHTDGDEFSTVVTGVLELTIWDRGEGAEPSVVQIGNREGLAKATFVPRGVTHNTRAIDGNCIYIEVKLGPFDKKALVMKEEAGTMA